MAWELVLGTPGVELVPEKVEAPARRLSMVAVVGPSVPASLALEPVLALPVRQMVQAPRWE